ncbi:hypothetical protein NMH_2137 [Neisseria meningitidis H44/76]|uniref:Uncharacterized protein n=1 Tax=Neisseria meningitidis serogroup B / serotype 15 (strain H44/76) TaxID=909420 RepID=E6MZW8_NEIMH|nr:hypothetical protein NMH_2137 [Neisseria meningitidis H44/76]
MFPPYAYKIVKICRLNAKRASDGIAWFIPPGSSVGPNRRQR